MQANAITHASSIASIKRRYKSGESAAKIADFYGVSEGVILRILRANKVKVKGRGRYPVAA